MLSAFQRIPREVIQKTLDNVVTPRLPRSGMVHNVMKLLVMDRFSNHIETRFFAYKGDASSIEKSFIVGLQRRSFFGDVAICTSEPDDPADMTPEMITGFEDLIDWKSRLSFRTTFKPEILKTWCEKYGKITWTETCHHYFMNIEDALKLRPNPINGYKIGMLRPEDGIRIGKFRPHPVFPGATANMVDCIQSVGGVGVYQSDVLRCWIMNSTNGQFFGFYVGDKYLKRGLGEWAITTITKMAAKDGLFPNALLVENKTATRKLTEKVGYKQGNYSVEEIRYSPHELVL